jgi:hypothetical protein
MSELQQRRRAIRLEPFEPIVELPPPEPALEADPAAEADTDEAHETEAPAGGRGTCLYLGPQGQRCWRPAGPSGFCARHVPPGPGAAPQPGPWLRRLVALLVAAGLLGPLLVELVRSLLHGWRAHR